MLTLRVSSVLASRLGGYFTSKSHTVSSRCVILTSSGRVSVNQTTLHPIACLIATP
jgi:hypothetical protein